MIISRIDSCSFYSYSKQLRLIRDSDDLSWTREQILFLDSSRLVTTRLPLSLSRCRTKVIFREFTEVYAVTKSPSPPHIPLDNNDHTKEVRCSRSSGRLFWIVSHREPVKNPPRTRRRSNVHAFSCAPSMIHQTRNEMERDGEAHYRGTSIEG